MKLVKSMRKRFNNILAVNGKRTKCGGNNNYF